MVIIVSYINYLPTIISFNYFNLSIVTKIPLIITLIFLAVRCNYVKLI